MKIRVEKDKVQYFSELNDTRATVDQLSNEKVRDSLLLLLLLLFMKRETMSRIWQTNATNSFLSQLEAARETETEMETEMDYSRGNLCQVCPACEACFSRVCPSFSNMLIRAFTRIHFWTFTFLI